MKWYKVVKNIHGRQYLYWQATKRVGRTTKTYNKYIGPSNGVVRVAKTSGKEYTVLTLRPDEYCVVINDVGHYFDKETKAEQFRSTMEEKILNGEREPRIKKPK